MNYNQLGSLSISEISFGCMSLSGERNTDVNLLRKAFDQGINFYDTADLYDKGENEKIVGEALKSFRKQIKIATKAGNVWKEDGSGWYWDASKKHIIAAAEESLSSLKTDYIDYYQLHGGTMEDNIPEVIEAFEFLKNQGKILEYGISSIRPTVIREYAETSGIAGVMMQYSLLDRRPEEQAFPLLKSKNIGVLARGSLAKGLLINKQASDYLNYSAKEVEKLQKSIENHGDPLCIVLGFVLRNPVVSSAVAGIRTTGQLNKIIESYQKIRKNTDFSPITSTFPANQYENHRLTVKL